ncbi:hypothetical protein MJO52_03400 [Microbulbifer variabilis]|uniref:Uncharacterized protein n=1 Tax=Microbulbifer variabilis TaxID=266805 RepID=A0ABY4VD16_9GAMM|nr:hypothetical protein [Microbulbifer variabilis]USD22195.1 hypothetical protein MJO52_03400 [Microbulbifer variabilis]
MDILETLTLLEFLSFRNRLSTASGFQSFQFCEIKVLIGIYHNDPLLNEICEGCSISTVLYNNNGRAKDGSKAGTGGSAMSGQKAIFTVRLSCAIEGSRCGVSVISSRHKKSQHIAGFFYAMRRLARFSLVYFSKGTRET